MLVPLVLFSSIWADLSQPVSRAELARWKHCKPTIVANAYWSVRRELLLSQLKKGMTKDQVNRILGDTSSHTLILGAGKGENHIAWHGPIGLRVVYRWELVAINGYQVRNQLLLHGAELDDAFFGSSP